MRKLWLHLVLSILLAMSQTALSQKIVETTFGKIRGSTNSSRDGREFYQFLGIPYGKAERFQPPQNPDAWSDIRDATTDGNVCPQILFSLDDHENKDAIGDEDCLNLNIYTPMLPESGKTNVLLPVMVVFGGGGDLGFAGALEPQYYMDTDMVIVNFNARLGFLGFLNLNHDLASGNQRLKDEALMLKWVQANIRNFGGDPGRVTLNGVDTGGADAGYHLISPMSKGLAHGAILQNGNPLTVSWSFVRNPIYQAKIFGKKVGCPVDSRQNLYDCLMGKRAGELVLAFHRWINAITTEEFPKFGPSIERVAPEKAFLVEHPAVSLKNGRIANKVPLIATLCGNPGAIVYVFRLLLDQPLQEKLTKSIYKILPYYLDYETTVTDPDTVTKKIVDKYFNGEVVNEANAIRFRDLISDRVFGLSALKMIESYAALAPTYVLWFDYAVEQNGGREFGFNFPASFYDDVSLQFPFLVFFPGINVGARDYNVSKRVVQLMHSFVEFGKPTKMWGDMKSWHPYTINDRVIYAINEDGSTGRKIYSEDRTSRRTFWIEMAKNELALEFENPPEETF